MTDELDLAVFDPFTALAAVGEAHAAAARKERMERDRLAIIERDKKLAAEKEARRVADKVYRTKVHREIEKALREYVIDEQASDITAAIIAGKISQVEIIY